MTKVMAENHKNMVESAPDDIEKIILSGSDLDKRLNEKQEKAQKEHDEKEKYKLPKTELDIFLRAPKIIVYEGLLGEEPLDHNHIDAILIDLGQIELQTKLLKLEKDVNYHKIDDPALLYDIMIIKLGRLKITTDFSLVVDDKY